MAHRDDLDLHRLSAAYVLDALDDAERVAFEATYVRDDDVVADVLEFREVAAALAASEATPPPAHLRSMVLAEVSRTRQLAPRLPDGVSDLAERRRRRATTGLLALAAAVVLILGSAVLLRLGSNEPSFADQLAAVLAEPDSQVLTLLPTEAADGGSIRVVWSETAERAVVIGDRLSLPPDDRVYELWLIDSGGPVPMSLLDRAADGSIRAVVALAGQPAAWGVTVEPPSGSPAPTGDILYLAEL